MKRTPMEVGKRYSMLTLIAEAPDQVTEYDNNKVVKRMCLVRCDCGIEKIVAYGNLLYGMTKSCGCSSKKIGFETMESNKLITEKKSILVEVSDIEKERTKKLSNIKLIESGLISGKLNSSWISVMHLRTREYLNLCKHK